MTPDEIREVVLEAANMPEVLEELGVPMYRVGSQGIAILCPDHPDRNPTNCFVYEKNIYCFACHSHKNVIDAVQHYRNCGFMQAVQFLSKMYGLNLKLNAKSEENVEPVIIPKAVFHAARIHDVAAFKKLYQEDAETAMRYLSVSIARARNAYAAFVGSTLPAEAMEILQQRIATLQAANKALPEWKESAKTKPLRVK